MEFDGSPLMFINYETGMTRLVHDEFIFEAMNTYWQRPLRLDDIRPERKDLQNPRIILPEASQLETQCLTHKKRKCHNNQATNDPNPQ